MPKIYNEIVIDMNPESHSYMEVLHEDSFEYSGDMVLAQGGNVSYDIGQIVTVKRGAKEKEGGSTSYNPTTNKQETAPITYNYPEYKWNGENWIATGNYKRMPESTTLGANSSHYQEIGSIPKAMDTATKEWGAADITKDDFIDPSTGEPRPLFEIAKILDPKLPGVTGDKLMATIRDLAPKYTGVPLEEKEFAKQARKKEMSALSKEARKLGAQTRGAPGGTGAAMRGAMTGTEDMATAFKQAQQGYKKDIYGLEKGATKAFEAGVGTFLEGQADWFTTPEGGEKKLSDWGGYEEQYAREQELSNVLQQQEQQVAGFAVEGAEGNQALGGGINWNFGNIGGDFGMGTYGQDFQEGGFVPEKGSSMQSMIDNRLSELDFARGDESDSSFTDELSSRYGADYGAGSSYHDILSSGLSRNGNGGNTFLDLLTQLPEAGGS